MEDEAGMWAMVEGTPRGEVPSWDVIDTPSQRDALLGNVGRGKGGGRRAVVDADKLVGAGFLDGRSQGGAGGIEEGDIWDAVEDERFRGHGIEGGLAMGGGGDFPSGGETGAGHLGEAGHRKHVSESDQVVSLPSHPNPSQVDRGRDSRTSGVTSRFSWAVNNEEEIARDPRLLEEMSRLRLVEEDRDALIEQVMRIKKQLELTRADRLRAQRETESAQQRMDLMAQDEQERSKTDRERLASLQSKVEQLSSQIESAKEGSNQMGPDSVESLRLATVKAEDELAKLAQDKGEHEQNLIKRIALTLKVLQIQKETGERLADRQKKIEGILGRSLEVIAVEKDERARSKVIEDHGARGVDQFYSDEGKRMRELSIIKAEAHQILRKCKAKAQRLLALEGGVMQDAQEAEYETRMHAQILIDFDSMQREHGFFHAQAGGDYGQAPPRGYMP